MIEGDLVIRVDNVPQQTPSEDPTLKPEDILAMKSSFRTHQ